MLKKLKYIVAPFVEELSALKSWVKITLSFSPKDNLNNVRLLQSKFSDKFNLSLSHQNPLILIDDFAIPQWLFINSLAAHSLAKEKNASLEVFSFRRLSKHHKIMFNSFDLKKFRVLRLSVLDWISLYLKYVKIVWRVKCPEDLINLELEGIQAGIDIYESILRHGHHTVKLNAMDTPRKFI